MQERLHTLEVLLEALDAPRPTLRRDVCGDLTISGRAGHIYASGESFLIVVMEASPRRWSSIKRRLAFCRLTQVGDNEGCLHLSRLPSPAEAALIRDAIRLKRRRRLSPEAKAVARANLKRASAALNGGFNDQNRGMASRAIAAPPLGLKISL